MRFKMARFIFVLCMVYTASYGQVENYNYQRELHGITEQWHKIILPDDIYGKVSTGLSDIRIVGVTSKNDTVEAPYILRLGKEKITSQEVAFKTLNNSHNDKGYFFTFEIPSLESINQIELDFKQDNFDWRVQLEGSQDQLEWFTLCDDYRIVSIKNESTDFRFLKINFQDAKYHYYRLRVASDEKPNLTEAKFLQKKEVKGILKKYPIQKIKIYENKTSKQTEIDIDLQKPVPVSMLKIAIADTFDYYRPISIQYIADSNKTEQGWKYNYNILSSGVLNSMEVNVFKINSTIAQRLKIIIHNQDNEALNMDSIQVYGYVHELVARFTEPATYFLKYGNEKVEKPQYDLERFTDKIPVTLTALEVGNEETIRLEETTKSTPLFENKIWLWALMILIILLLGWFSISMIRKQ